MFNNGQRGVYPYIFNLTFLRCILALLGSKLTYVLEEMSLLTKMANTSIHQLDAMHILMKFCDSFKYLLPIERVVYKFGSSSACICITIMIHALIAYSAK